MASLEVNKTKRYDCFVSYNGTRQLDSLELPCTSNCNTLDNFVERYLIPQLTESERRTPSVFKRSRDIRELRAEVFDGILQLRGGGVAVVLLTTDYLQDARCLAELRALLSLACLRSNSARSSEAITMRFVTLEPNQANTGAPSITEQVRNLEHDNGSRLFVEGLLPHKIHELNDRSTLELAAGQLADMVWDHWNSEEMKPNLGKNREESLDDMQYQFQLATTTEMDFQVGDVLKRAREDRTLDSHKVDELLRLCRRRNMPRHAAAIASYQRKWCSRSWSWDLERRNTMNKFIQEAESLQRNNRNDSRYLSTRPAQQMPMSTDGVLHGGIDSSTNFLNVGRAANIALYIVLPGALTEGTSTNNLVHFQIRSRHGEQRDPVGQVVLPVFIHQGSFEFRENGSSS